MKDMKYNREWQNFAYNVRWLRKKHGISKKNMAKLLHIGVGSLTKIENGELPPRLTIDIFFVIYNRYGISPKDQLAQRFEDI